MSEDQHEGAEKQSAEKPQGMLGDLKEKASDAWDSAKEKLGDLRKDEAGADLTVPETANLPPAPVTGDAGARAAGSVEDDVTDAAEDGPKEASRTM